jgi:flagellar hook capping protein FlgD
MKYGYLAAALLACLILTDSSTAQSRFFRVSIENTGRLYPYLASGAFDTPVGAPAAGPLLPGSSYSFTFDAAAGQRLSFATMFVQSNDLFYAPGANGLALWDAAGMPRTADVTAELSLWDAGTEENEAPGEGAAQAPRQSGADQGAADSDTTVRLVNDGHTYPATADVLTAMLTHDGGTRFTLTITNTSTGSTLKLSDNSTVAVPLAPGAFVVHAMDAEPLFTAGMPDRGAGLEALAEDGSGGGLAMWLATQTGVPTIFAPGVWSVHRGGSAPIFDMGSADRGMGLEDLAEDGNPGPLVGSLASNAMITAGIFNTPTGSPTPGALLPGNTYEFVVQGEPGDRLSLAAMWVQSNDYFVGSGPQGLPLFNGSEPASGNMTGMTRLWDAGTEADGTPGAGPDQAPRQAGGNTGAADPDGTVRMATGGPSAADVVSITITPLETERLSVTIENMSTGGTLAVSSGGTVAIPLAPGAWAVHTHHTPLFRDGVMDFGRGLEGVAEDGDPSLLGMSLAAQAGLTSGVFNTPVGAAGPAPLFPGDSYEFSFDAAPGSSLSLATMFVQSNDLFYAPSQNGLPLWDETGALRLGDVTAHFSLWDSGTEMNQEPGLGSGQAPRQTAANEGSPDANTAVRLVSDAWTYPVTSDVIRVSISRAVGTANELADSELPEGILLGQNYPNPFNPTTQIDFELARQSEVNLTVYDVLGREIRRLAAGPLGAGAHSVAWDGRDAAGVEVATGVYLYRLQTAGSALARTMTLLR